MLLKSPVKHLCLFQFFFPVMTLFFVFLAGLFKRWHKAGQWQHNDWCPSDGKCTSGPPYSYEFLVLHSGLDAPIVCVHKESDPLGTECRMDLHAWNHFLWNQLANLWGFIVNVRVLYIKSVPVRFVNALCRGAEHFCRFHLLEHTKWAAIQRRTFSFEGISGCIWKFVLLFNG